MMPAFYNDFSPYCARQLPRLIEEGLLPPGVVSACDVRDLDSDELAHYGQIHLFAGIGGFALAARLAGLPDDFDILTGGFPCQPHSLAGRRKGPGDDRFLWPEMLRIICARRPRWVLIENVPGLDDRHFLVLDRVCADLEANNYEVGPPLEIPACAVNAPHRRARLWIVAHRAGKRQYRRENTTEPARGHGAKNSRLVGDSAGNRCAGRGLPVQPGRPFEARLDAQWTGSDWIEGPDGKWRRVKPGIRLLAHGVPNRVAQLTSFGNAIVPQVAVPIMRAMLHAEI